MWAIGGRDPGVYDVLTISLRAKTDPAQDLEVFFPLLGTREVRLRQILKETEPVANILQKLWNDESGQDIAEYAVMLAVILVIVVGTVRLIGSNANNVFSSVGSAIQ